MLRLRPVCNHPWRQLIVHDACVFNSVPGAVCWRPDTLEFSVLPLDTYRGHVAGPPYYVMASIEGKMSCCAIVIGFFEFCDYLILIEDTRGLYSPLKDIESVIGSGIIGWRLSHLCNKG